jgi:hypothetical protein
VIVLRRTSNTAPTGGAWLGHSLRVGTVCDSLTVGPSLMQIMYYGLWKSSLSSGTTSRRPYQQLIVNFDLTSAIRDHNSKVEMQITVCIQRF